LFGIESDPVAAKPEALCGCMQELLRSTASNYPGASAAAGGMKPTGQWVLGAVLAHVPASHGDPAADADRSQLVLIESMMHQFGALGLESLVVGAHSMREEELDQWKADWNIDPSVQVDAANVSGLRKDTNLADTLLLISPSGKVAASWQYPVAPADVWLQIQSHLGTPPGAQQMPACSSEAAR
jgi:hypothetical protein